MVPSCSFSFVKRNATLDRVSQERFKVKVLKHSKIAASLDVSCEFWTQFRMHNPKVKKNQLGLYEIENINNANVGTIAVDPKEYFEKFKDRTVNKKQKGVK